MLDTAVNKTESEMAEDCSYQNKLDIALIKRDIEVIRDTFQQSESAICRLEQVAVDISRNASLHEQKINSQDRLICDIERVLETQRQDNNDELEKLNNKINTVNVDLTNKINQTERTILNEIHQMKGDLSKKISEIDMYRYMIMGAIAFGVFLLSKAIDIAKLFN